MSPQDTTFLLHFIVFLSISSAISGITFGIVFFVYRKRCKCVIANSRKLPLVDKLNSNSFFYQLSPVYNIHKWCRSKRDFDHTSLNDLLIQNMTESIAAYRDRINYAIANKKALVIYETAFSKILDSDTGEDKNLYDRYRYFKKLEKKLCHSKKPAPVTAISINVTKRYTSPRGRNSYYSGHTYEMREVIYFYNESLKIIKNQEVSKYQRTLMSDSLRYNIMKRDGFRCVLCGATQKDGVKLHVDHIVPVSKGGKTILTNLRTLCDRCNMGKSDKYDPYGLN